MSIAAGGTLLNVFGGKITTFRVLAEAALEKIRPALSNMGGRWTAGVPLPGGDFPVNGVDVLKDGLIRDYPFLTEAWAMRLVRAYGTEAREILGTAKEFSDLGKDFGATLTEAEVDWMMRREFVEAAEDAVWRRSRLGLRMTPEQISAVQDWIVARIANPGVFADVNGG